MAIDENTVRKAAKLARLDVPEARLKPLAQELSGIMAWIETLNEVDVEGVEPLASNVSQTLRVREDLETDNAGVQAILRNAPKSADGFFVVPKVVE